MGLLKRIAHNLGSFLLIFVVVATQTSAEVRITTAFDRARPYTSGFGFDAISWTVQASWLKFQQTALGSPHYLGRVNQKELFMTYMRTTQEVDQTRDAVRQIFSDPTINDPEGASADLRNRLHTLEARQRQLAPFAEAIIQQQLSLVLEEAGLTSAGQPIPSVLYHVTPLPRALIISPRDAIRQDASILLLPDLPVDKQEAIEQQVASAMDVSTLVVPVGGLGTYPTMVISITNLPILLDIVAHEWIHNYLTLRPLGLNYAATPELRTMNETTASIAGAELSALAIARFYPEFSSAPDNPSPGTLATAGSQPLSETPPFDFRAEMRVTRLRVDELLAEGKIEEAEAYMDARRQIFWENGYAIRKLNQAYFAFYGAYADTPGGAAGEDPVGPAVRALREKSPSLAAFINRIAAMTSFAELQKAVGSPSP